MCLSESENSSGKAAVCIPLPKVIHIPEDHIVLASNPLQQCAFASVASHLVNDEAKDFTALLL